MRDGWSQSEAVALCRRLSDIAPSFGAHVALTGGTLYKEGYRKDVDVLFYRIRQVDRIDVDGLLDAIAKEADVHTIFDYDFVVKTLYGNGYRKPVDIFFPERDYEKYPAADIGSGSCDN